MDGLCARLPLFVGLLLGSPGAFSWLPMGNASAEPPTSTSPGSRRSVPTADPSLPAPLPPAFPDPPPRPDPAERSTPDFIEIDVDAALMSQPVSGPEAIPINLATALHLAGARPLDIAAAAARVDEAMGLLFQAKALKIPNLNGGVGYYRHDGFNQNLFTGAGFIKGTNALQVGGGPTANFGLTDAIFAPLAARRVVDARRNDLQAAANNVMNTVAQRYFDLQEAKGRLVGAEASIVRADQLVRFARGLAPALIAPLEINRAQAQLENLRQYRENILRDWEVASARLAEVLLLDSMVLLNPIEPPFSRITLIAPSCLATELVPLALQSRPEIASQRALLIAAEKQLKREKGRILLPNIIVTTPGTANAGVLPAGQFYSGADGKLSGQGGRADFSVGAYWQLQNAGFGNIGLIKQRKAQVGQAEVEVSRTLFQVRSEVAQSLARLQTSNSRVPFALDELKEAVRSADKNFVGLRETTRPAGELLTLVVRPQEVVAALQSLNVAFQDYASAVNDFNRAQFELYRAIGQPSQIITTQQKPILSESAPPPPMGAVTTNPAAYPSFSASAFAPASRPSQPATRPRQEVPGMGGRFD